MFGVNSAAKLAVKQADCRRGQASLNADAPLRGFYRTAFSFLALLAIAVQSLVVQTHIDGLGAHARAEQGMAVAGSILGDGARFENPAQAPASVCIVCKALATVGAVTLAAPPALNVAAQKIVPDRAPLVLALAPAYAAHAWQSRAPPIHI